MKINVKDKTLFIPKRKLPEKFRQMGRVTFSPTKSGLLLYQEESGEFYGMFNGKIEALDETEVLIQLGYTYIKYDPRIIGSIAGHKGKGKQRKRPVEDYKKMQALSARARKRNCEKRRLQQS